MLNRPIVVLLFSASLTFVHPIPIAAALDLNREYEQELIRRALKETGLRPDPRPAGKTIERIVIVRENIIADSDPWPNLLNIVHVKTRDHVVRQEMLLQPGDPYDPERVAESERNLREMFILSVARIIPCRSAHPSEVVLLVATKDLWSLRLNMVYSQTGEVVSHLDFTPTETNFLGRNKRLSLSLGLSWLELHAAIPFPLTLFTIGRTLRDRFVIGQAYEDRRILGTRLRLLEQLQLHFDGRVPCGGSTGDQRDPDPRAWCPQNGAGGLSGVFARLRLSRPLFSLATEWGFSVDGWIDVRQVRFFRQNPKDPQSPQLQPGERPGVSLEAAVYSGHSDGAARNVPHVYDRERMVTSIGFTRSFGTSLKHDLSWGLLTYRLAYSEPAGFPFDEETRRWYTASVLPRSETASAFFIGYATRPTRFVRLRGVRSFALSEDYAIGPQVSTELRIAQNLVGPSLPFAEGLFDALYRWHLGDDLLTLFASGTTRYQPGIGERQIGQLGDDPNIGPWINNRLELGVHNVSPRLWLGRLHGYAAVVLRQDDLDRGFSRLGGSGSSVPPSGVVDNDSSALRGYLSGQFTGRNLFRVNVEYRTRPINILTMHVGGVLFYDGGSAWGRPGPGRADTPFDYYQSVGLGLRALFPQFDREALRIDVGVPLSPDQAGALGTWFAFSFGQAF